MRHWKEGHFGPVMLTTVLVRYLTKPKSSDIGTEIAEKAFQRLREFLRCLPVAA